MKTKFRFTHAIVLLFVGLLVGAGIYHFRRTVDISTRPKKSVPVVRDDQAAKTGAAVRTEDTTSSKDLAAFTSTREDSEIRRALALSQHGEIGEIIQSESGSAQKLVVNGSVVFSGKRIRLRSVSRNGVIAVEAITGDKKPIDRADISSDMVDGKLQCSLSEIWVLENGLEPRRISPADIDARYPIISQDGRFVAFTGRSIGEDGLPGREELHILDMQKVHDYLLSNTEGRENRHIAALEWSKDAATLTVFSSDAETGSRPAIHYVAIDKL